MAENSAISWTDHTFNPWRSGVLCFVARLAQRQAVRQNEPEIGKVCEALDVVGVQIAAPSITALPACEGVSCEDIEAPSLVRLRKTHVAPLGKAPIFERVALLASVRFRPRRNADLSPSLRRQLSPFQLAHAALGSGAHLLTRRLTHPPALHWRDKGRTPLQPRPSDDFATAQFWSVCHG